MRAFWRGVIASVLLTGVEAAGRFTIGTPLVSELMAQRLFAWIPMGLFEFFISFLGHWAKWFAFAGMFPLHWLLGGILAWGMSSLPRGAARSTAARWLGRTAGLTLLWLFVFLPLVGQSPFAVNTPVTSDVPAPLAFAAYAALFAGCLTMWERRLPASRRDAPMPAAGAPASRRPPPKAGLRDPGRRAFLSALAGAGLFIALAGWQQAAVAATRLGEAVRAILRNLRGMVPEVTPSGEFYKVSKNLFDPRVPVDAWQLLIDGEVERPLRLRYADLTTLRSLQGYVTLCCISNEVGGDLIGNALWEGIPLRALLEQVGMRKDAVDIQFEAYDGYTDSIPIAKALDPATLVAWKMNGEPLPWDHGAPARLIVPGIYGMKSVKWLTRIAPVTLDFKGYWETRGWSDAAVVKTMSRIDVPKNGATLGPDPVYVAGIAFGGDRGIARVEVSFDGGQTWQEAAVAEPLSPYAWVHWVIQWRPSSPGRHTIVVRAADGTGTVQTAEERSPAPDGASGWHSIRVAWRA